MCTAKRIDFKAEIKTLSGFQMDGEGGHLVCQIGVSSQIELIIAGRTDMKIISGDNVTGSGPGTDQGISLCVKIIKLQTYVYFV